MLEKLIEIVLKAFLRQRSSKEKAEDSVKEKLVFLHESLVDCHGAYLRYSADSSEMNLQNWKQKARALVHVLDEIGLTLAAFSQETFDQAVTYTYPEGVATREYNATEDEAEQVTRMLNRLRLLQSEEPTATDDDSFREATKRLRQFMKETMSRGEIKKAQNAYRKDTYWDQSL